MVVTVAVVAAAAVSAVATVASRPVAARDSRLAAGGYAPTGEGSAGEAANQLVERVIVELSDETVHCPVDISTLLRKKELVRRLRLCVGPTPTPDAPRLR